MSMGGEGGTEKNKKKTESNEACDKVRYGSLIKSGFN